MKRYLIFLLFAFTLNAQDGVTRFFIDRDASGSANGTSWTNAWHYINDIDWSTISAGDTIYISGGTDSTKYVPDSYYGGTLIFPSGYGLDGLTFSSEVVICPSWETGHNGDVYICPKDNSTQYILEIHGISNIKLYGLNIIDTRTNSGTMCYLGGDGVSGNHYRDSLITIENCNIIGYAHHIYLSGYKITIKDCYIEGLDTDDDVEPDPFGISGGLGSHVIDGNIIIMRNDNTSNANHYDGIQISNIGWSGMTDYTRQSITICNNLILNTPTTSGAWNNMIYNYGWDYTPSITFYVYNNIIVNRITNSACGGVAIGRLDNTHRNSLYFLNNTLILQNNGTGNPIVNWSLDTLVVKNNLIIADNNIPAFLNLDIGYTVYDINYNHYAEYGGLSGNLAVLSSNYDWSAWQGAGYDVNSANGNSTAITFTNKYGENKSDYYTSTGRDLGTDLSATYPFLSYDILGNPRDATPDIGALEYQAGGVDSLPNTFTFTDITNATRSTLYTSNGVTLAGFDSAYAYASGNVYTINAGSDLTGYTRVFPNDVLRVKLTSSSSYSTPVSVTLNVGGRTDTYTVTTESYVPPSGSKKILKGKTGKVSFDKNGKVIYIQ